MSATAAPEPRGRRSSSPEVQHRHAGGLRPCPRGPGTRLARPALLADALTSAGGDHRPRGDAMTDPDQLSSAADLARFAQDMRRSAEDIRNAVGSAASGSYAATSPEGEITVEAD